MVTLSLILADYRILWPSLFGSTALIAWQSLRFFAFIVALMSEFTSLGRWTSFAIWVPGIFILQIKEVS
jgi:hypothetical protein